MKLASGGVDKSMCPTSRDWPKPWSSRVIVLHVLQPTRRDPHSRILLAIPGATSVDCLWLHQKCARKHLGQPQGLA